LIYLFNTSDITNTTSFVDFICLLYLGEVNVHFSSIGESLQPTYLLIFVEYAGGFIKAVVGFRFKAWFYRLS